MTPATPGRLLGGRYRLLEPLARGGMASVWVAEDLLLARRVAVKTLRADLAADSALRSRFRNEAIAAASVAHPGIVATFDTGEDADVAYIVMELVAGPNLRRVLDERGRLPTGEAVRIARAVAIALDTAHRNGIVHRDIKPANVLLASGGAVKVTDFGIAKTEAAAADLTGTGMVLGTARYLAPEQVRGEPADARADIYAVGLLLYEMLAGRLPFGGDSETEAALARLSTRPAPLPSDIPPDVAAVVERCLAFRPDDRYQEAADLADALGALAAARGADDLSVLATTVRPRDTTVSARASGPPTGSLPAPPRPIRRPARPGRRAWPFALMGALLIVGGAAGGYLLVHNTTAGPGGTSTTGGSTGSTSGAARITGAHDFDPEGDHQEDPGQVSLAIDGNPATSWETEHYRAPAATFGGGKKGVGLYVTLAASTEVTKVEVDTAQSGWSAQIYLATAPADSLAGWGSPVASGDNLGRNARFTIAPAQRGSVVLLWLTRLPDSGFLDVSELRVG